MAQKEIVKLELLSIEVESSSDPVDRVRLETNHGTISCQYYKSADARAVVWIIGTGRATDSPGNGMYERLAARLAGDNIASLRLDYRKPGNLIDCVLDVLLGIGFLRKYGHQRVTLVGHSFGGSVAINASVASPAVTAVAALSSQLAGADDIAELAPRPVLLMHGSADEVRSEIGSRHLFELAADPKELILYEGCGHDYTECSENVERDLLAWLHRVA